MNSIWQMVVLMALMPVTVFSQQENSPKPSANTLWFRQVFSASVDSGSASLLVHGHGAASVYLNGQRLCHELPLSDEPVFWDVTELLRSQRNGLAVAISRQDAAVEPQMFLSILSAQGTKLRHDKWKNSTSQPPIGWQQTDFNDRDWKPDQARTIRTAGTELPDSAKQLTWSPETKTSRTSDGRLKLLGGDHVVLLGGTFVERAQSYGYLESALSGAASGHVTFRNLGWSGDTVFAESRGIFDPVSRGYERMIEHVRSEEPDVVLLCYGQNEAMTFAKNDAGRKRFVRQLEKLIADLKTTGGEVVLLSPHPFLDIERPYPSPVRWNPTIEQIVETERSVALHNNVLFVDLFTDFIEDLEKVRCDAPRLHLIGDLADHPDLQQAVFDNWSDNGMHWTKEGYMRVAAVVKNRLLGGSPTTPTLTVDRSTQSVVTSAGDIKGIAFDNDGKCTFQFRPHVLSPETLLVKVIPEQAGTIPELSTHTSSGDSEQTQLMAAATDETGHSTCVFANPNFEKFRNLVIQKNELYFHRWRPQNITYLFGFRKHEQGNNAREIAQYDPLIADLERQITVAKEPQWITFTVSQVRDDE